MVSRVDFDKLVEFDLIGFNVKFCKLFFLHRISYWIFDLRKEKKPFMAFSGSGLLLAYFHGIAAEQKDGERWTANENSVLLALRSHTSATIFLLTTWSSQESAEVFCPRCGNLLKE